MQLTFASYNIHKAVGLDRKRDHERILRVLREVDADVIALQEVDRRIGQRASVIPRAAIDDTPWHAAPVSRRPRSLGWHGNAILVRRDIEIIDSEPLDLPTLEPRGAVRALLEWEGKRFCVVGMHLDLSGLRRRDQIHAILESVEETCKDVPTVLMGDFNQWGRETGAMRVFGSSWNMVLPGRSFPSRRPLAHFDRIVSSHHWKCQDAEVHHSQLAVLSSDHLPVWAELAIA